MDPKHFFMLAFNDVIDFLSFCAGALIPLSPIALLVWIVAFRIIQERWPWQMKDRT